MHAKLEHQFGSVDKAFDYMKESDNTGLTHQSFEEKMVGLGASTQEGAKQLFQICNADFRGD